jgi:chitin disaccharide deacetylase
MKKLLFIFLFPGAMVHAQQTLQERLGYPKNAKLLVIHADDLGVAHSENTASFYALEKGSVNSASIMVPCPWFPEVAAYAAAHPNTDFGLHLTLTSEWELFKWGPLAGKDAVPGLVNAHGYFYSDVDSVIGRATAAEVEKELRAQIEKARLAGIDFTHLDSHMGTLYSSKNYLQVVLKLGREYKVPVMLNQQIVKGTAVTVDETAILINDIYVENPQDYAQGAEAYYTRILQSLQPGVHEIIVHAARNDGEMQAVTINHPDYGAAWRQADLDFFTSERCKALIQQYGIQLVSWREIRDKLVRK